MTMDALQFTKLVAQRNHVIARCETLFIKPCFIRTKRDEAALRYLLLIFEHHRGIIMLAPGCRSPAFSLIRPITDAFSRLHVTMFGTDNQFQALVDDSYRTQYKTEGELIDEISGFEPLFGPLFGKIKDSLHGFTHAGTEHLSRMTDGRSIGPNYSDQDVSDLLHYVTLLTLFAGVSTAHFLNWMEAEASSMKLLEEFLGVDGTRKK
jgi:hypothetical protein